MLDRLFKTIEKITPSKWRWVLNHDGFKRYFANTGWMFLGQMFSLIVSFFIGAWIARYLGPENYGVLSYVVAFVGMFGFLSALGVDVILNRELIKFPERSDILLGTSFRLKLLGGFLSLFLAIFCSFIFNFDNLSKILVTIFSFSFVLQSFNVINIYFQSRVNSKVSVKSFLVATLISSALKVVIILLNKGIFWIIVVYSLDSLWQILGFIFVYNRFGLKIKNWKFDKSLAVKMFLNSWPLMLASAAGFVYLRIDQVIVGFILGNHSVGIYAAAVKLTEIWYFIPSIICTSLFPAIINSKKISKDNYKNRLNRLYILMSIVSFLLIIMVVILAKPIIYFLFGADYLESISILRIYALSSFGLFLGVAVNQYLISENFVKTIFFLNFFAMVLNVFLNLLFIPIFGLIGAAWASVISYLVIPAYIFFKK